MSYQYGRLDARFPVKLGALHTYGTLPEASASWAGPHDANYAYGLLGNERAGDCTFAGFVHMFEAICLLLGQPLPNPPTAAATIAGYLQFTGGQDSGCVEADVLAALYRTGLLGLKLDGYAPGRKGLDELWQITQYFGAAYLGIMVPAPCQDQFAAGEPWDLTGTSADNDIEGGHCVVNVAFDQNEEMSEVLTWCPDDPTSRPVRQKVTFRWLDKYLDEQWAPIPDQVKQAGALGDFNFARLQADLSLL